MTVTEIHQTLLDLARDKAILERLVRDTEDKINQIESDIADLQCQLEEMD